MDFLKALSDQVSDQFSLGENNQRSLNLGKYASQVDLSAETKYTEQGYLRLDPYNLDTSKIEVLLQDPSATILIKKKMFSSIAENYRPDFMDADEALYYKAISILFDNKCNQISTFEKLSKIQSISSATGSIRPDLMPLIFSLTNGISDGFTDDYLGENTIFNNDPVKKEVSAFVETINSLKKIYAFNLPNDTTTWIDDNTNVFQSHLGSGTGVIEITNFTSINVSNSVNGAGGASISIEDPYKTMLITEWDIERAINDATNATRNLKSYRSSLTNLNELISKTSDDLNRMRYARGASPISFKINTDTLVSKKVRAIIDRSALEIQFTYSPMTSDAIFGGDLKSGNDSVRIYADYIKGGEIAGNDGLDDTISKGIDLSYSTSEKIIFQNLIASIFNRIQLEENSKSAIDMNNKKTNYTRRKMRYTFLGKLIIQPMDVVHIYMNSKSRYDDKITSKISTAFTAANVLQSVNNSFVNLENSIDLAFGSNNLNNQAEKNIYVGPNFPNYLWSVLRPQFINENEGTHVFGGKVDASSISWNNGSWTISINCSNNYSYFKMGVINFKPGADNFNGAMMDPLTPFKSSFDDINYNTNNTFQELLDENKFLLSESGKDTKNSIIKLKSGPYAGQQATGDNLFQDQSIDPTTKQITRTFYAPDGLAYKWKEGIGTFVQFGGSLFLNNTNKAGNQNMYVNPFAGQDAINALSLMISGYPYNFITYWKATKKLYAFDNDPHSKSNSANSYATSLRNDLKKSNALWGNFIPFKTISISDQSYANALETAAKNQDFSNKINENINKLAGLQNSLDSSKSMSTAGQIDYDHKMKYIQGKITNQIDELNKKISEQVKEYSNNTYGNNYIVDVGGEVDIDLDNFTDAQLGTDNARKARTNMIKELNFLTRRMSYDVRANVDKNLLIVDDFYDKDYDLMAFDKALKGKLELYDDPFQSTESLIRSTAQLLNLEVFCDSQGHIRIRSPKYNRIPSSIFFKMMYLKKQSGVQIYPQLFDDIFQDRANGISKRIEILEDNIRLDCAVLNRLNDSSAEEFINTNTGWSATNFKFISNSEGKISSYDNLISEANPDSHSIKSQSSNRSYFTNADKYSRILGLTDINTEISIINNFNNSVLINDLIDRIQIKSQIRINKNDYILSTKDNSVGGDSGKVDIYKTVNQLGDKIRERQRLIKVLYNTLKNAREYKSLDDPGLLNKLLSPGLNGSNEIPEIFSHMIEDESNDDYGPGSGSRYIIKNSQITRINISENNPEFNMVQVNGYLNDFVAGGGAPPGLQNNISGNGLTSAVAIDYDSWRSYGLTSGRAITLPMLNDPVSQCAPYAAMLLSRARKNIIRGSIEIVGKEYMQVGEVVFVEDLQMLFYIEGVSHSLSQGNSFSTTLTLSYGHAPGEYIPTPLDMFGKVLYNNRDSGNTIVQRQSNPTNDVELGALIFGDSYSKFNKEIIKNIQYMISQQLNNNATGRNIEANLELRIYYNDSNPVDQNLLSFAKIIKKNFTGEISLSSNDINENKKPEVLDARYVNIVEVNMNDELSYKSPSQKAIDASKNIGKIAAKTEQSNVGRFIDKNEPIDDGSSYRNKVRSSLFKNIVDCWVSFNPVIAEPVTEESNE